MKTGSLGCIRGGGLGFNLKYYFIHNYFFVVKKNKNSHKINYLQTISLFFFFWLIWIFCNFYYPSKGIWFHLNKVSQDFSVELDVSFL